MTRQVTDQGLQAAAPPPEAAPPALLQPPEAALPALLQLPGLALQLGLGLTEHAALSLSENSLLQCNCLGLYNNAINQFLVRSIHYSPMSFKYPGRLRRPFLAEALHALRAGGCSQGMLLMIMFR